MLCTLSLSLHCPLKTTLKMPLKMPAFIKKGTIAGFLKNEIQRDTMCCIPTFFVAHLVHNSKIRKKITNGNVQINVSLLPWKKYKYYLSHLFLRRFSYSFSENMVVSSKGTDTQQHLKFLSFQSFRMS